MAPLLFWFIYSELGQYTIEKEHPAAQDYCQIVNVTKAETGKAVVDTLVKLKVEKSFFPHCIDEKSILSTSYNKLETEHFHTPQKSTKIYLFNNSFLI
ncbi:MAG: hypothetical protein KDC90_10880 [Ignavibacteriae bacterium]|nr:hypothetical protein [Ignavibacteriota bacterium]